MSVSKRRRFEVFKRDEFTCVYCGRRAPNVKLEVDHQIPRCAGGTDAIGNLVTACWDCNRGKAGNGLGEMYYASFVPTLLRDALRRAHEVSFMAEWDQDCQFDGFEPETAVYELDPSDLYDMMEADA